ncbi:hypothetical protein GM921_15380 [Pedobacter sp. LMG 31464]|uniref:Uncharacterized protein n=1 Tax=Pedobacter planticolens TaxID=2679964 RepID=A0A923E276_9SPHI|nr:hypothetical protein [Pedobacter planticolens]MBB2146885.1 hypothetical protein [Pedobacter planticolens]
MRRHNKKLLYPTGIISLVFLPILCIWNLDKQKAFEKLGAMDVAYMYHKQKTDTSYSNFYKLSQGFRSYTDIEFSGDNNNDKSKLQYAQFEIERIINSKDTLKGIHFKFTEKAKYWNFVKAIEISHIENINSRLDRNDLWLFYIPSITTKEEPYQFICGTNYLLRAYEIGEENRIAKIEYMKTTIKLFALPLIFFFLMCYFTFRELL